MLASASSLQSASVSYSMLSGFILIANEEELLRLTEVILRNQEFHNPVEVILTLSFFFISYLLSHFFAFNYSLIFFSLMCLFCNVLHVLRIRE